MRSRSRRRTRRNLRYKAVHNQMMEVLARTIGPWMISSKLQEMVREGQLRVWTKIYYKSAMFPSRTMMTLQGSMIYNQSKLGPLSQHWINHRTKSMMETNTMLTSWFIRVKTLPQSFCSLCRSGLAWQVYMLKRLSMATFGSSTSANQAFTPGTLCNWQWSLLPLASLIYSFHRSSWVLGTRSRTKLKSCSFVSSQLKLYSSW
jgi:hypothetical protein